MGKLIVRKNAEKPTGFEEIGTCNKCGAPVWQQQAGMILTKVKPRPVFNCMCHLTPIQGYKELKEQKATPTKLDIKRIESKPKNFYF